MNYKKQFLKLMLILVFILFIIMGFNYSIDPFQQFGINKYGRGEQRKINPGIARNYKYDSIIIGTSTSQNIHKRDVKRLFNVENTINLSMSGSTQSEQEQLLNLALKYNKVKLVIYGMDMFSYTWNPGTFRSRIPDYLYSEKKLLKFKYLLNVETLNKSFSALRRVLKGKQDITWIDNHSYHFDNGEYNKYNVYSSAPNDRGAITMTEYNYSKMCSNFNNFLKFLDNNKNIQFKIYFVPYTMVWWYYAEKYDKIEDIIKFKYYVVNKLSDYENVDLYEFQDEEQIYSDNNYKDILHISPQKSKEIVEKISQSKRKVTKENYDEYMKSFLKQLKEKEKLYKTMGL